MGGEAWGLEDERAQNASIDIHENAIIMMNPLSGMVDTECQLRYLGGSGWRTASSRLAWVTELVQGNTGNLVRLCLKIRIKNKTRHIGSVSSMCEPFRSIPGTVKDRAGR